MLTIKQVNAALKSAGIDAELVRGEDYFYFCGPAMDKSSQQGVYGVCRLNDISVDDWVNECLALIDNGH